ncbi:pectate lyase superfamily protein-domain-containing protein [Pyronema domesticum]|uniref:Similar to Glucan 1,3-beta-glucosidase acc. no. P49426 n=1 Tax=Pyronema omphalodes (strain CBS 100304) TaxID=1076935 RepID=U4LBZ0_PYROM|nr:pectate lyase superfamily protein-domain-containing protein [Pyronema domesticum]CCX29619.1 Similar to Glucan 1,3-beta-glucosidase; acc. no. P49426 [Pyronema omphalodes CBS 100304]
MQLLSSRSLIGIASFVTTALCLTLPLKTDVYAAKPGAEAKVDVQVNAVNGSGSVYADVGAAGSSWWLEQIEKQGMAAFNNNPAGYKVFRNVKDYGAKGDGSTDDTNAINAAIQDGTRCGKGCDSSTVTPAMIYFPSGTYRVSKPIVAMYYSQLVGNPTDRPVIKGLPNFSGMSLIDSDPYEPDGSNWYTNQNNFFRAVRHMIIDTTDQPAGAGTGLHWQVAQATSLVNLKFVMSQAPGNSHQGIFMDNGSGGFMSDLEFVGGKFGAFFGNQQFMTRNLKFSNCQTAIYVNWNWQWTFKSLDINNCEIGVDITSHDDAGVTRTGSVVVLDSKFTNVGTALRTTRTANTQPTTGQSAVLDNIVLQNVGKAVAFENGGVILDGGSKTIDLWAQGKTYNTAGQAQVVQGTMARAVAKPQSLLGSDGKILERSRPQYIDTPVSSFISVKSKGAKGDGKTDDTAAIKAVFSQFGGNANNVIYFPHGVYIISDTVDIPVNTRIVGEVWSVIMANGAAFQDRNNPKPVWRAGKAGDSGVIEMQELIFQTKGPQPGAVLLEWNSRDPAGQQGVNGIWDVHFRVAGSRGTDLEVAQCLKNPLATNTPNPKCEGAFMHLHIGKTASVYIENCWAWTADHALDDRFDQITVYNGRGIYSESTNGPVWMYAAAAEHNTLYQYQLANTQNTFMSVIQSETPYFQSNPGADVPFASLAAWNDPSYAGCTTAACKKSWALRILNSKNILIYGAGLYSFFENYAQDCINPMTCQDSIFEIKNSPQVSIWNLNTIASNSMVDLNGQKIVKAADNKNNFCQTVMGLSIN